MAPTMSSRFSSCACLGNMTAETALKSVLLSRLVLLLLAISAFVIPDQNHHCSVLAFPYHAAALEAIPAALPDALNRNGGDLSEEQLNSILKDEAVQRLHELGQVSDSAEFLQRTFLSPAAVRAGQLIRSWMTDAGLFTWVDDVGNVHGRFDNVRNPRAPALLLGSHLDTVVDAGLYDGALGIITSIAAVKALYKSGQIANFPRPIEIIAFSDEEGIRFQSTFLGSAALAGTLSPSVLQVKDKSGITVGEALQSVSLPGTPTSWSALKYVPASVWAYVEVHIEQGPVLENKGVPLGVVDAIAGQNRLRVSMKGEAGHAGTVPMSMRRDPMPAAALSILAIDEFCRNPEQSVVPGNATLKGRSFGENSLFCTVGEFEAFPGASNVIPGEVVFTVDLRTKFDILREATVSMIERTINDICQKRALTCSVEHKNEARTTDCDPELTKKLTAAANFATHDLFSTRGRSESLKKQEQSRSAPTISSGAGHDALAMAQLTKVGMMFVRCAGGMSHSPEEFVLEDDIWAGGAALLRFLEAEELEPVASSSGYMYHDHGHQNRHSSER